MSHHRAILVASWAVIAIIDLMVMTHTTVWPAFLRAVPEAIMQWIVLHSVAAVGWPWAPVAVASSTAFDALARVAIPTIGALPLSMALAVPAAFLLSRYSGRGWWWIAAPVIVFLLNSLVPIQAASPRTTLNLLYLRRFTAGALEGTLLAYILSQVIDARSTIFARAARPETTLPVALAAMMAVSACFYGATSLTPLPDGGRELTLVLAFCNLAGLVLLLIRQTRAVAAGLAFGTALLALLTTTVWVLLGTLFAGFAAGAAALLLLAVPVIQVLQIAYAYRAVRAEGPNAGTSWIVGVLGPVGLMALLSVIRI